MDLRDAIRDVPDFPKKGIVFKDITTLLLDPTAFEEAVERMVRLLDGRRIDKVAYIRFASVYREFADIGDLKQEVDSLAVRRELTPPESGQPSYRRPLLRR